MKSLGYILVGALLLLGVSACEKEEIIPDFSHDSSVNESYDDGCFSNNGTRGNEGDEDGSDGDNSDLNGGGENDGIKDPDKDKDFDADDNIVDPDEDEDFEENDNGE